MVVVCGRWPVQLLQQCFRGFPQCFLSEAEQEARVVLLLCLLSVRVHVLIDRPSSNGTSSCWSSMVSRWLKDGCTLCAKS